MPNHQASQLKRIMTVKFGSQRSTKTYTHTHTNDVGEETCLLVTDLGLREVTVTLDKRVSHALGAGN